MRIAVNARFLTPHYIEGIGGFTGEVARRLARDHPEHEFLFFFDRRCDPRLVFADNVRPVVLWPPTRHPLLLLWWFEHSLARAFAPLRPDAFLSPDGFLSLRSSVPTLLIIHDLAFEHFRGHLGPLERFYCRTMVRAAARRAARIATVSAFSKREIVETYGLDAGKIDVVSNGIGEEFAPLPANEQERVRQQVSGGAPYFLHVGAIQPRKNVATLLRAFDLFKQRSGANVKLLLAGRLAWRYRDVLRTHKALAHRDDVLFLGYLPGPLLERVVASARALACVSLHEGFGLPVAEAMACGVPAIVSNRSALPETAGDAALLVDPLDFEAMATALERISASAGLRAELARRGRARAAHFNWDVTAAAVWRALRQVAAASR
jgi:glycosyltransferase involved in cell wall biosynthesis